MQHLTGMADAADEFNSIKGMKDPRIPWHHQADGAVLPAGEALGADIGVEFQEGYRFFDFCGVFFIDGRGFIDNAGDGGDRYFCPAGDISYADSFFIHFYLTISPI